MRVLRGWLGFTLLALASCARAPVPAAPTPARPQPARSEPAPARPATMPHVALPVPPGFQEAVAHGTRTPTGRPGANYWQQHLDYRIDAELDPRTARLNGEERVAYINHSPDTLTNLTLHLYQNLFQPGAPRTTNTPNTSGITLEQVSVNGRTARDVRAGTTARPFYQIDHTIMTLALPRPMLPGDTAELEIAWHFTVPPGPAPRLGHEGREMYLVAQWYPQIAVYDDVGGWDTHPYLGTGEFYLEYGDFDVSLTLPEGYLVGATGTLQNADEVLTPTERSRLALALRVDTVVHVVGPDDQRPESMTQQVPGRQLTWRFRARSVRDFAFAASNRYLWDATHADVTDAAGSAPRAVPVNALYRPEARTWRQAAAYTRHAIAFHSAHWLPYMYPQMTSAEGPEPGMEYPMLVFVSNYANPQELLSVVTHEVGHEWFPMMVGSNEHEFAWQDEGVNSYIEALATHDYAPETDPWAEDFVAYLSIAGSEEEVPMMRPADQYGNDQAYGVASYMKPALVLHALGTVIGSERVNQGLAQYAAAWRLKHPVALDFFHDLDAAAGQDLGWYWYPWFYTTEVLDQAVAGVEQTGDRLTITVDSRGRIPMPLLLRVVLANGRTEDFSFPVTIWATGARRVTESVTVAGPAQHVIIDPDHLLPDANRSNNEWNR